MRRFLPPNLLALFVPRDPIPYPPPASKLAYENKSRGYSGMGQFLKEFEDRKDTPPSTRVETREECVERRHMERAEQVAYKLEQEIAMWDLNSQSNTTTANQVRSLFVARINYDTSESKLRREFEFYGHIKKIVLIHNRINGKLRGYAFIEYEHERDMYWDDDDSPECAVCLLPSIHSTQLSCNDTLCYLCIKGVSNQTMKRCPLCRRHLPQSFMVEPKLLVLRQSEPRGRIQGDYKWFYGGRRGWWQYDPRTTEDIERAFLAGLQKFETIISGNTYVINFQENIQHLKTDSLRKRSIKRDVVENVPNLKD